MSDALFYATMGEMCAFARSYTGQQFWDQKYLNAALGINNEGRRERRDEAKRPSNPEGGVNTLKGES